MIISNRICILAVGAILSLNFAITNAQPSACLTSTSTLHNLIKCMEKFIVRFGTWIPPTPTNSQRIAWSKFVTDALSADNNCSNIVVPNELSAIYKAERFSERESSFCVLYESQTVDGHFAYGWGIVIVPAGKSDSSQSQRQVHISVAHPFTDGQVHLQGVNLFYKSKSRSLLISGLCRDVVQESSACEPDYYKYDGAHDNSTMFHTANLAVMNWQLKRPDGCPWTKCAFIQLHGKAQSSCTEASIFLSAGLGRSPDALKFYQNKSLPIQRLKNRLGYLFKSANITVGTPLDDRTCSLVGGSNVFGRVLNRVPFGNECQSPADAVKATGYFVHAEQSDEARGKAAYDNWAQAILDTFQ